MSEFESKLLGILVVFFAILAVATMGGVWYVLNAIREHYDDEETDSLLHDERAVASHSDSAIRPGDKLVDRS